MKTQLEILKEIKKRGILPLASLPKDRYYDCHEKLLICLLNFKNAQPYVNDSVSYDDWHSKNLIGNGHIHNNAFVVSQIILGIIENIEDDYSKPNGKDIGRVKMFRAFTKIEVLAWFLGSEKILELVANNNIFSDTYKDYGVAVFKKIKEIFKND